MIFFFNICTSAEEAGEGHAWLHARAGKLVSSTSLPPPKASCVPAWRRQSCSSRKGYKTPLLTSLRLSRGLNPGLFTFRACALTQASACLLSSLPAFTCFSFSVMPFCTALLHRPPPSAEMRVPGGEELATSCASSQKVFLDFFFFF